MAFLASTLVAFTGLLAAVQATPVATGAASAPSAAASAATTGGSTVGNFFQGKQIYANPYYASEILSSAVPSLSAPYNTKASAVAEVGTFAWLDSAAKVPTIGTYLKDIQQKNAAGASPPIIGAFVVYDLPNRDCAAAASNGEYSVANNGLQNYQTYINNIKAQIQAYPNVDVVLLIEPDSLANLVTNLNVANCSAAESAYKAGVTYAMQQLNLPNVAMYLDAGHAGWLGWSANIGPAAQLFGQLYQAAGSPSQVRGLATNVANYNAWSIASPPSYTSGDSNYDEQLYINALAPLLTQQGFPAHFITDTSEYLLLLVCLSSSNFVTLQAATVSSPPSNKPGVTGATSSAPASVSAPQPTLATLSLMLSSGSSQVENAMVLPTLVPPATTTTAVFPMPCNPRQRRELGSRLTLPSFCRMPTLLSRFLDKRPGEWVKSVVKDYSLYILSTPFSCKYIRLYLF